ncbi:MAG: hypothetical protein R6W96_09435 [Clostridia bacterium]
MRFDLEAVIQRDIGVVYGFLMHIDAQPRHGRSQVKAYDKVTPGPPGPGTRYREVVRLPGGKEMVVHTELVDLEVPCSIRYTWHSSLFRGILEYHLATVGEGTFLTQHQTLETTCPMKILSPVISLLFWHKLRQRMQSIKALLESGKEGIGC